MSAKLVAASASDLAQIADCARSAYAHYVERMGQIPAPMIADFPAHLADPQDHVDLIQHDGMFAGYVVWRLRPDDLFIDNIALLPSAQGQGLGRAAILMLQQAALSHSRTALELYTNEKMVENIAFYKRLGFVETRRITEHGFARVYMRCELQNQAGA